MKTVVLATAAAAALCLIAFTGLPWSDAPAPPSTIDSVDAVLGAGGFNVVYPVVPGNGVPHETQVTRRLTKIERLLRQRDVSSWPTELRAERARNLDRLHAYRLRASYPHNYDRPNEFLPCFIDRDGRICAVGYLVEQSAGRGLAEKINARHQYSTIAQIHEPELDAWIARSGLTRAEVGTIQEPESWPGERIGLAALAKPAAISDTVRPERQAATNAVGPTAALPSRIRMTNRPTARPATMAAQPQPVKPRTAPTQVGSKIQ